MYPPKTGMIRKRSLLPAFLVVAVCLLAAPFHAVSQQTEPFHQLRAGDPLSTAPGGDTASASQLDEVRIGYFGPSDADDPTTGLMWQAARAAIEEANGQGGLDGVPFRLVAAWSADPWGTGVAKLARLVYREKVWAIVGGIDGPSTHLAEQIVAKARVPLMSPVSTDKTANLANVPWLFSLAPGDHLIAPVLAEQIERRLGNDRWALISSDDHDSRQLATELKKSLSGLNISPSIQFVCRRSAPDFSVLVSRTLDRSPAAVVVLAGIEDSARLVRLLRAAEFCGPVFGGPAMGRQRFLQLAGEAAQDAIIPCLAKRGAQHSLQGTVQQTEPMDGVADTWDDAAKLTYDAVQLTVAAIRRGGLNRARIRESMRELAPWNGIAGEVCWDSLGSNTRRPALGIVRDGRVQCLSVPETTD